MFKNKGTVVVGLAICKTTTVSLVPENRYVPYQCYFEILYLLSDVSKMCICFSAFCAGRLKCQCLFNCGIWDS